MLRTWRCGFDSCRTGQQGVTMKAVTFQNKLNGEQVVCDDTRNVEVIEGVDYLLVRRPGTDRRFLMRKEVLQKIPEKKIKTS